MLSRALRTRQHTSICRLQLHQCFIHRSKSTSTSTSTLVEEETRTSIHFKKSNSRTAFIRTWEPFHNLADTWALLRVVERKYGRVAEAHFLKDYEMKNRYQVYTYVVFCDQDSLRRVPKEGQSFHIQAPVVEDKPGGLGLDDIRHLLDSTDRDVSFELPSAAAIEIEESKERMIGARIERAPKDFYMLPKTDKSSKANMHLARMFLRWGGFHKLEPIEGSRDITEAEWFEKTDLEQVRMRAALQWCSQITGFANPAVLRKPTTRDNDETVLALSASLEPLESNSPLDIPSSHGSTSEPTPSPSLLTESLQFPSQSPPESIQLPPESRTAPTTPPPGQLTPEQLLAKEALKRQMSRAKQLMVKNKRPAARKSQKPEEETLQEQMPHILDEFPEESPPQSKGVIANIWKLFGR